MPPSPDDAAPDVIVTTDPTAAAERAADVIGSTLRAAVERRGRADWATTGGSTPVSIYRAIVSGPLRTGLPWPSTHVWWGDDRYVPRDHPLSNVKALDDVLLQIGEMEEGTAGRPTPGITLPADNVHPFPTGEAIGRARGAAWCATTLAEELRAARLPDRDGWPAFDLVLLGIGGDGHLLSVFPGSPALDDPALAMAIPAPTHIEPHVERVTLNPAIVGSAARVLVVATGEAKADVIGRIFAEPRDPSSLPAQLALRAGATWILDEVAAARLPR